MRALGKFITATAVAGLMVAQPAVAATRSADSLPDLNAPVMMVDRAGSSVDSAEEFGGSGTPIIVLIVGVAAALLIALLDKDDDGIVDSPG